MKLRLFISSVALVTATSLVPVSAQMAPNLGALTGSLNGLTGALGAVPVVGGMVPGGGMNPMLPGIPGTGGAGSLPELPGLNGLNSSDLPLLANDQPVGQLAIAANQQNRRTDLPRLSALPIPEGTFPIASPSIPSAPGSGSPGGAPTIPGLDGLGNVGNLASLIPSGPNGPAVPGLGSVGMLLEGTALDQGFGEDVADLLRLGPFGFLASPDALLLTVTNAIGNFNPAQPNLPTPGGLALALEGISQGDIDGVFILITEVNPIQ